MRFVALTATAMLVAIADPASACGWRPGGPGMRAAVAERDDARNEAARSIYLATLTASEDHRSIFRLRPTEAIVGELPQADVWTPNRSWNSCGHQPSYYADWDEELAPGELLIALTREGSGDIEQLAALDTPEGERLLALARARQQRLSSAASAPSEPNQ